MEPLLLGLVRVVLALQISEATVTGVVRDEATGIALAHAVVALNDLGRSTTTDSQGRYHLAGIPAGPQHLSVRHLGYSPRVLHALVPRQGRLEIDIALRAEPLRLPGIEVRPGVAIRGVNTDRSTDLADRRSSIAAIRNHPLLAEPDALQGMAGGEVVVRQESPDGVHIRGGASDQTGYLLDGIPVFSPYHSAGVFSAWNPDALASVELWSAMPSPAFPDMLSGTISARTRRPGPRPQVLGGASTLQGRVTVDGPLPGTGAGFLVSLRTGFPGLLAPPDEASYLQGESGDWLVKLEAPLLGGQARLLGTGGGNEIGTAALARAGEGSTAAGRFNSFEWNHGSFGAEWIRGLGRHWAGRVQGWSARGTAGVSWVPEDDTLMMGSSRRDHGVVATLERVTAGSATLLGMRWARSRTRYEIAGEGPDSVGLASDRPLAAVFGQQSFGGLEPLRLTLGGSLSFYDGEIYPAPRAQLRWTPFTGLNLSGSLARSHQFAQSLRNPESVVANVFPADLYLGAGATGIPVARSDQMVLGAEYHPAAGVRIGLQGYLRELEGLALVAPRDGSPFAVRGFEVGSGHSRGASLEVAASMRRSGVLASYGLQQTRYRHQGTGYVPQHGVAQSLEGGFILFPAATASVRLGAAGIWGRRAASLNGGLEWESCNLLDRGCEFSGTPTADTASLGARLPPYLRLDLSVRKHWHLEIGGRDGSVALFGTLTNVLGRRNLLARGFDPLLGQAFEVEMRPRAPLLLGLDWRY